MDVVRVVVTVGSQRLFHWAAATALPVLQLGAPGGAALAQAMPLSVQSQPAAEGLVLKARRLSDSVEVLIEGTGPAPVLQQSNSGGLWFGQLATSQPLRLGAGSQRLALPEAGIESITLQGSGGSYQIQVKPMGGAPLARPLVSADGRNLILSFSANPQATTVTGRLDLNTPGRVPQSVFAPPLQPRAVAPPLGDMAVGSMVLRNRSFINVSGPRVTLTLRNAPAKDALMALAQMGNYGFVYVDDAQAGAAPSPSRAVSIAFRNESYARAVNSVLLAAGIQGKLEGSMIVAGPSVQAKTFGTQLSKVYRLNQVSANSAADYLASLGATINKTTTTTSTSNEVQSTGTPANNQANTTSTTNTTTSIESFGASVGPLRGLIGTTDNRLGTITLIGDSAVVAVAENYLRQLDLRQRQVALAVRILDVNLDNNSEINNSFAFRYGNNFIVNDNGQLLGAFGSLLPPTAGAFNRSNVIQDAIGAPTPIGNPGMAYPKDNFFNFLNAQIQSDNTKVLASPTLILQENPSLLRVGSEGTINNVNQAGTTSEGQSVAQAIGIDSPIGRRRANEAAVRVGANVVTGYDTESTQGAISCTPNFSTAGLVLGARIEKIDDNGFVTFSLSPSISAVVDTQPAPSGCGAPLNILSVRSLDTGAVRVRDGQTLILTGVISDAVRAQVTKWPILGDIPLIGQFFRSSGNNRQKRELVILVTPRIINDGEGGTFGYGYQPSTQDSRSFLGAGGS